MERRGEFAAASLQTESYLEREHNVRWTVLPVATAGVSRQPQFNDFGHVATIRWELGLPLRYPKSALIPRSILNRNCSSPAQLCVFVRQLILSQPRIYTRKEIVELEVQHESRWIRKT